MLAEGPSGQCSGELQLFWSGEDGGFIAVAPDLPGCSAFGETENTGTVAAAIVQEV